MCDTIPGELLLSFHKDDDAGYALVEEVYNKRVPHVTIVESIDERLHAVGLGGRKLSHRLFRLRVPPGQEAYKVNYLQFFYKHRVLEQLARGGYPMEILKRSDLHLQVVPHSLLSVCSAAGPGSPVPSFTSSHGSYVKMMGWPTAGRAPGARVLILDTGIDPSFGATVVARKDFVASDPSSAQDDHSNRHGTLIAQLIEDLVPGTEFTIYKVADASGRAAEWDVLAGCCAANDASVINMSLQFGLGEIECPKCGRQSHTSRCSVFENIIRAVLDSVDEPLVVAAAGNAAKEDLAYPARFGHVIAVTSVDGNGEASEFSNSGTDNAEGGEHERVFAAPGGQGASVYNPTEFLATSASGNKLCGTSFAAAYVSALLSRLRGMYPTRDEALSRLRSTATRPGTYARGTHGHGIAHV